MKTENIRSIQNKIAAIERRENELISLEHNHMWYLVSSDPLRDEQIKIALDGSELDTIISNTIDRLKEEIKLIKKQIKDLVNE